MTYNVPSGTLNTSIPYHTVPYWWSYREAQGRATCYYPPSVATANGYCFHVRHVVGPWLCPYVCPSPIMVWCTSI